jgi:hypothetical protein
VRIGWILPVIVGDSDGARYLASVDSLAAVCNVALLRPSVVACTSSGGSLIRITSWTVLELTVRSSTVVLGSSTVSLYLVSKTPFPRSSTIHVPHQSSSIPPHKKRPQSLVHTSHSALPGASPAYHASLP